MQATKQNNTTNKLIQIKTTVLHKANVIQPQNNQATYKSKLLKHSTKTNNKLITQTNTSKIILKQPTIQATKTNSIS